MPGKCAARIDTVAAMQYDQEIGMYKLRVVRLELRNRKAINEMNATPSKLEANR